jgi:hypothetical protein
MVVGGSVREAIQRHRSESGMDADGGISDRWVVLRIGRIPMPFLNTAARRKALSLHDVNHLVAGTGEGNVGEAEISAWELASGGCGKYAAAWTLDLAGMLLGMVWPVHVIKAFTAGRTMRNVYNLDLDQILDLDLEELRQMLRRPDDRNLASILRSVGLFIGYLVLAVPAGALFLLMVIISLPAWALTKDTAPVD